MFILSLQIVGALMLGWLTWNFRFNDTYTGKPRLIISGIAKLLFAVPAVMLAITAIREIAYLAR